MKTIELNDGVALVDDDDFERISAHRWTLVIEYGIRYAVRSEYLGGHRYKQIRMHREVIENCTGFFIDHIDGDGLNNQKSNLRLCNNAQNQWNSSNKSFRGVGKEKGHNKWYARIRINGIRKRLGMFDTREQALDAYKAAAELYHGEFHTSVR